MKYLVLFLLIIMFGSILAYDDAYGVGFLWKAINFGGSLVSDLSNVAGGCIDGQVLSFQASNSTFICSSSGVDTTNLSSSNNVNATIIGDNSTFTNNVIIKTISAGAGIAVVNGTYNIIITNTVTDTDTTNISSLPSNATLVFDNSTNSNKVIFKNISAGTGIQIDNGSNSVIIKSTIVDTDTNTTLLSSIDSVNATIIGFNETSGVVLKGISAGNGIRIDNGTNAIIITNTQAAGSGFTNISTAPVNATILADNSTVTNRALFKTISAGTGIQVDNGTDSIIIKATSVGGGFTNIASESTTSANYTLIADNSTVANRASFKTLSSGNGITLENNAQNIQVNMTVPSILLTGNNITTASATTWINIWTIPMASGANMINGYIVAFTDNAGTAVVFNQNTTIAANSRGTCTWQTPTAATTINYDNLPINGTSTGTGETAWMWPNATAIVFNCGIYSSAADNLNIQFRSETAGRTVTVAPNSFYTYNAGP
jgi:hypothetical protein